MLLEKSQEKRHHGDREDAKDRGKKDAVRTHFLLFSMDLGHVQNNGRAGYGAQDEKACLKGIRHRKDECDRKRDEREYKKLSGTDQVHERLGEKFPELDRRQADTEDQHAYRRRHLPEKDDPVTYFSRKIFLHTRDVKKYPRNKRKHGRIDDRRTDRDVFFVQRQAIDRRRKDQDIHRDHIDRRIAGDLRMIRKQRLDKRHSEESAVSECGTDGQHPVFVDVEFLPEDQVKRQEKCDLDRK